MAKPASIALVPCGHVCFCDECADATPSDACPICRQNVNDTLKLSFAGPTHYASIPEPPIAMVDMPATQGMLCLTDAAEAEHQLLREVEWLESWAQAGSAADIDLEQAMEVLDVSVTDDVANMRDEDEQAYVRMLLTEVSHAWRCFALRMHPDKVRARDSTFWTDERSQRLTSVFQYANEVHERLREGLHAWCVKSVGAAHIAYFLTNGNNLRLDLVIKPERELETVVEYVDGFGRNRSVIMPPGLDKIRFYQNRQPNVFLSTFDGFTLLHRTIYGPHAGETSHPLHVRQSVPRKLRKASTKPAKQSKKKPRQGLQWERIGNHRVRNSTRRESVADAKL